MAIHAVKVEDFHSKLTSCCESQRLSQYTDRLGRNRRLRMKIKIFNREICVCALLATNSFMRKKQRRNGENDERIFPLF